jgi:hypothetical protein
MMLPICFIPSFRGICKIAGIADILRDFLAATCHVTVPISTGLPRLTRVQQGLAAS